MRHSVLEDDAYCRGVIQELAGEELNVEQANIAASTRTATVAVASPYASSPHSHLRGATSADQPGERDCGRQRSRSARRPQHGQRVARQEGALPLPREGRRCDNMRSSMVAPVDGFYAVGEGNLEALTALLARYSASFASLHGVNGRECRKKGQMLVVHQEFARPDLVARIWSELASNATGGVKNDQVTLPAARRPVVIRLAAVQRERVPQTPGASVAAAAEPRGHQSNTLAVAVAASEARPPPPPPYRADQLRKISRRKR